LSSRSSYFHFDGLETYIEVPNSPDLSLTTTGALAVSAWIRLSTLKFPRTERKGVDLSKAFVHWMERGDIGQQAWVFRM
jgi:hypothetical protein